MKKKSKKGINRIVIIALIISAAMIGWAYYLQVRKIKFEYELDPEIFVSAEIDGINSYFISEEITELKGSIKGKKPDKLKYTLYGSSGYVLGNGKLSEKNDWIISDVAFLKGANILVLEARFSGRIYPVYRIYTIYNENEENEKRLNLEGKDTDGDGLDDLSELKNSYTNPEKADSDGNGINDGEEDTDGDGLTNATELQYGCLVTEPDSDLDGLNDAEELKYGCNPCKYDTDEDGVSDSCEIEYGLDPCKEDDNYKVTYKQTIEVADGCNIVVASKMDARDIYDSFVSTFPAFSVIADEDLDCVLSQGIVLSEKTRKSKVKIKLSGEYDKELYVCTVNENGDLTAVNVLGSKSMDISKYMKKDKGILFFTDIKEYIKRVSGRSGGFENVSVLIPDDEDFDHDGFINGEDPDMYSADVFKTYDDYLKYYFGCGKDAENGVVIGFAVNRIPDYEKPDVINLDKNSERYFYYGHSWAIFSKYNSSTEVYSSEPIGFYASSFELESLAKSDDMVGRIEGLAFSRRVGEHYNELVKEYDVKESANPNIDKTENLEIVLPIGVVNGDFTINRTKEYIENYKKYYNLYKNNCTTFVIDLFAYLGIKLKVYGDCSDVKTAMLDGFTFKRLLSGAYGAEVTSRAAFLWGCSPGQAAYNIMLNYPEDYVFRKTVKLRNSSNDYLGYTSNKAIESVFVTEVKSKKAKGANVVEINDESDDKKNNKLKWDDNYLDMMRDVLPYLDSNALFDDSITTIENLSDVEKMEAVFEALTWYASSIKCYPDDSSSWPQYYRYNNDDVIKMASIFTGYKPSKNELSNVADGLHAHAVSQDEPYVNFKVDDEQVSAIMAQAGGPECSIDKTDLHDDYVDVYYSIHWIGEDSGIPWVAHFVGGDGGLPKFEYAKRLEGSGNGQQDSGQNGNTSCYAAYADLMEEYKSLGLEPFSVHNANDEVFYGYAIRDINSDGTPELILVGGEEWNGYELLRMYTYKDGKAIPIITDDSGKAIKYAFSGNKIRLWNSMLGSGIGCEAAYTFEPNADDLTVVAALSYCAMDPDKNPKYYRITAEDGIVGKASEKQYFCFDYKMPDDFHGHTITHEAYEKGIEGYDFTDLDFSVDKITSEEIEKVRNMK